MIQLIFPGLLLTTRNLATLHANTNSCDAVGQLTILSFNVLYKTSKDPEKEESFASLRIPRLLEMLGMLILVSFSFFLFSYFHSILPSFHS
jgi:hypothetical protein